MTRKRNCIENRFRVTAEVENGYGSLGEGAGGDRGVRIGEVGSGGVGEGQGLFTHRAGDMTKDADLR